jgi:type IV pilus assembly protein PilE
MQRANRAHAKAALLRNVQWMERTATAQGKYPPNGTTASVLTPAGLDVVEGGRYTVGLTNTNAGGTTYTLTAVRLDPGANASDKCGDFTIDQTGTRGLVNNTLGVADCWGR